MERWQNSLVVIILAILGDDSHYSPINNKPPPLTFNPANFFLGGFIIPSFLRILGVAVSLFLLKNGPFLSVFPL